jgi:hypothetical protein
LRHRPELWVGIALGLVTLAMSLRSRRFIPLFALSASLSLAPALATLLPRPGRWRRIAEPAFIAVVATIWLARYPLTSQSAIYLGQLDHFPVEVMNFADANGIEGKVFAYYNWGGYLHFRTQGRLLTFIDGRADMVFPDAVYLKYVAVLRQLGPWQSIIDSSGADYVLWPRARRAQAQQLLDSGQWELMYDDFVAYLLVRSGRHPAKLQASPASPWRDLALGERALLDGELAEAEQRFTRALDSNAGLIEGCMRLALVQGRRGESAARLATLGRCQRFVPDVDLTGTRAVDDS